MGTAHASTGLRVVELDPRTDTRWDRFVTAQPDALVFHHGGWIRVLEREYGRDSTCLAVEDAAGELHGVLPLMVTTGMPFGLGAELGARRLASLPRTPLAGPLAPDAEARDLLVARALEVTPEDALLQIKVEGPVLEDVPGLEGRPWRETYVVELPERPEDLRFGSSKDHTRLRSRARYATKQGVTTRLAASREDLREWYMLHLQVMRHHMVPPRPWRVFAAMWDELRPAGLMELLLAEREGRIIAGNVMLMAGSMAFYGFNGADRAELDHRANDLLQWEAIHRACAAGFRRYDLGEVEDGQEGLARFKRKWGAEPRRLYRYYGPSAPEAPASGGNGTSRRAELAGRAWRRTPLHLTAIAGRLFYRFM